MKTKIHTQAFALENIIQVNARIFILTTLYIILSTSLKSQSVAINSNGAAPDPNSILDLSGSSKGLLLPRMTDAQMNALTTPRTGMLIFNTTQGVMMMQHGSDVAPSWQRSATNITTWNITGNAGIDDTREFLGTTDAKSLIFKTNNTERLQINTVGEIGAGTAPVSNTRLTINNTSNSTSTSTVVKGQTTQVNMGSSANADTVILFNSQFSYTNTGGTIEDFIGIKVGDISGTNSSFRNSGTITNTYGVFIGDLTDPAARGGNTPYAIYNGDENARNYHAGNTGFGEPNPTSTLHIKGSFKFDDGSPAGDEYKVLEFDASGNARWTKPSNLSHSTAMVGAAYVMGADDQVVFYENLTAGVAENITLPWSGSCQGKIITIINSVTSGRMINLVPQFGDALKTFSYGGVSMGPGKSREYISNGAGIWIQINGN